MSVSPKKAMTDRAKPFMTGLSSLGFLDMPKAVCMGVRALLGVCVGSLFLSKTKTQTQNKERCGHPLQGKLQLLTFSVYKFSTYSTKASEHIIK